MVSGVGAMAIIEFLVINWTPVSPQPESEKLFFLCRLVCVNLCCCSGTAVHHITLHHIALHCIQSKLIDLYGFGRRKCESFGAL